MYPIFYLPKGGLYVEHKHKPFWEVALRGVGDRLLDRGLGFKVCGFRFRV